jgi:hypothetical protein
VRQVIDGKTYDTETATKLISADAGLPYSDFAHWSETLYRTPRGRYFLSGGGGPMSRWGRSAGLNSRSGSTGIYPLSEDQAREWVERYANEVYEDVFGVAEPA